MMRHVFAAITLMLVIFAAPVIAQNETATVVADRIQYNGNTGQLIASGNVKVFFEDRILSAERILYNSQSNQIEIPDPFTISDGNSVISGRSASIDGKLEQALIRGAEALIAERLSISAENVRRGTEGLTRFETVIASTCETCGDRPVPFWRIRASNVIYDPNSERLIYENARLELFGVPVFGSPRFSTPQPGVERSSGFLEPRFISNTTLGVGGKLPYYIVIDAHSDVTLTPFVTSKGGAVLEAEYRRLTKTGGYSVNGAIAASDALTNESINGYIEAAGKFYLPKNYILEFGIELSSDFDQATSTGFMELYDYSDEDRLENFIKVSRTKTDSYFEISASFTQSFRVTDGSEDIPVILPSAYFREKYSKPILGGSLEYSAYATGLFLGDEQFYSRLGGTVHWQDSWITNGGLVFSADALLIANGYAGADTNTLVATPITALELKYPLRMASNGVTHVLEPIVQLVWSPNSPWGTSIENIDANDSTTAEFEETNLFSLNRFPGTDAVEAGLRANVGLRYLRYAPSGWELGVTIGRVFRAKDLTQFSTTTANGLEQKNSDYVATVQLGLPGQFNFVNRLLFDKDFDVSKNEFEMSIIANRFVGGIRYIYLDDILGTSQLQHELSVLAQYNFDSDWSLLVDWRENLVTNQTIDGTIGFIYQNECAKLQFSFSVEYDSAGTRETEFGVQLSLLSFGGQPETKRASHRCGG